MEWIKRDGLNTVREIFMRNTGIENISQANGWFTKSHADSYRIDGLDEAAKILEEHKEKPVTIVGDYDADGVTSTAILYLALRECGFKDVRCRIPRRFSEGFGINSVIIDGITDGLVLTCDNGIAGIEAVRKAKEKGLTVIVTDHHQPVVENGGVVLPEADLIINPNAVEGSADYSGYCGAGIALKLARRLIKGDGYKKFIPLAAIGTVADVMELREENYVIVREGLEMMSKTLKDDNDTSALKALLKLTGCSEQVTASDIAYKVAPSLNAFSRLEDSGAEKAVNLLVYKGDSDRAGQMARMAIEKNALRKSLEAEGTEKAMDVIREEGLENNCPIVAYVPGLHEGVVGIIAAHIAEKHHKPALIFTDMPTDLTLIKGSARAYGNYDVKREFDKCPELFEQYGGHAGAAGMTIRKENLYDLSDALNAASQDYDPFDADDVLTYDLEVDEQDLDAAIREKERYAPYGEGNPEPVFKVRGFVPVERQGICKKAIGSGKGTKISGLKCEALSFRFNEKDSAYGLINPGVMIDLIGSISLNRYNTSVTPQVIFKDIHLSNA